MMSEPQLLRRAGSLPPPSRQTSVNLASVDLNMLVALEALLKHCNVTHAAGTVGLSQPAMSRALSRLRGMFSDDLLVRTSAGYVRTVRGEQLHQRLPVTLDAVREIISSRNVAAEDWCSTLRLAMPDHQALLLVNGILDRLGSAPANSEIVTEPLTPNMAKRLETGELAMAIGQLDGAGAGFFQRTLYLDDYACLLRHGHPALQEPWSAERFFDLQHAIPAPVHDVERTHLAEALAEVPARNRHIISPSTIGTAFAAAESEMVLTVPQRVASKLAVRLPVQIVDLPIEVAPYEVKLLWHERSHRNTEHGWIRAQIAAAAQGGPLSPDVSNLLAVH